VRRADRRHDLRGAGGDAMVSQLDRQRFAQACLAGRVAVLQGRGLRLLDRSRLAHGGREHGGVEPFRGQRAEAGHGAAAGHLEHAADERRRAVRQAVACGRRAGPARVRTRERSVVRAGANEEAAVRPRLDEAAREQLVVGRDDGRRAHLVVPRAFADRGQARSGPEQALPDQLGVALRQLLGQRRVGAALQGVQRGAGGAAGTTGFQRRPYHRG
jgi:hypothetical protein